MYKFLPLLLACFMIPQGIFAQCEPQLLDCNAIIQACDVTPNDPQYWNEIGWWDQANQSHDLAETKLDLSLSVEDNCPGDTLLVRCLLFLDLDGNGVAETVVDSDHPPAPGMVNFNNALNPNYSGGQPRAFDQRPVFANQKWRFAVKTTVTGNVYNYSLQWVNDSVPNVFVQPELAYNFHKVRWVLTTNQGVEKVCEKSFLVKDCKAPTVVCLNGLSVNVMPTQMIQLWASDFLQYTEDNVTTGNLLKIGVRKSGTGTGFPVDPDGNPITSVIFTCDELGTQSVELWSIDAAGNADYCETFVIVQDNLGNCDNGFASIEACVSMACGNSFDLGETAFDFLITYPNLPPTTQFDLGTCGKIQQILPPNTEVTITPNNDANSLNGITTFDLVQLSQFIAGSAQFTSPYQWVAADANNDKKVDSLDILECTRLILGIYTQFPNNTSYRFIDKDYVFPSPDPLSAPFPESITVNSSNLPSTNPEFVGVKICDITCAPLVGFYDLEPENTHLIGTPEPNPSYAGAMLPLQLIWDETVVLELSDLSGRLLYRTESHLPAGPAMLEIPAYAMPRTGVYVWKLRAGDMMKSGRVVRL